MNQPTDHKARYAAIHGAATGSKVSFINAAAGSGKTDTVVLRVIQSALLNDPPIDVRRIGLATFTIAAAGEMKARVRQVIETVITWCELDDPAGVLADSRWRVVRDLLGTHAQSTDHAELAVKARHTLGNLDAAPWGTLHGLAMSIVENNAPALPLPAAFRLEDEQESVETAVVHDATFRGLVAEDDAFEVLSQATGTEINWEILSSRKPYPLSESSLEKLLKVVTDNLVGQRGFESDAKSVFEATVGNLAQSNEAAWSDASVAARSFFDDADPETILGRDAALFEIASGHRNSETLAVVYLTSRNSDLSQKIADGDVIGLLARVLVSDEIAREEIREALKNKKLAKSDIEPESQSFIETALLVTRKKLNAKGNEASLSKAEVKSALKGILDRIEPLLASISAAPLVAAQLLDTAIGIARQGVMDRRDNGVLRYDDLIDLACVVLSNSQGRESGLDMLVIDEFQDSDPIQHAFLEAAEGVGLEVVTVGDQRQSIYGFRGATPELFANRLSKTQQASPELVANLDVTFRHNPVLVTALNAVFSAVIANSGVTAPNAIPFREVHGEQSNSGIGIRIFPYVGNAAVRRTVGAKVIAQEILEIQRLNPGDSLNEFAILTETRNSWREIKTELTNKLIPYLVTAGGTVDNTEGVRGFMAVLRYLATGRNIDRVGALLSVWIGGTLKEAALGSLLTAPLSGEAVVMSRASVLESFRDRIVRNGNADATVLSVIEELNCYALIREVEKSDPSLALDLFADLRFLVDEASVFTAQTGKGFRGFVRAAESGEKGEKELNKAKSVDGGELVDAVQLTTIHSAKGLEYKFVFVVPNEKQSNLKPASLWPSLGEDPYAGAYINSHYLAPMNESETGEQFKERLARRARFSKDRELYVALTRAKEHASVLIPVGLDETDDASQAAAFWWGKARKPQSAAMPDILADRLRAIDSLTSESLPTELAESSITIQTIEVSVETDSGLKLESQLITPATMPTQLDVAPAQRIITGSRVKKSAGKFDPALDLVALITDVILEDEESSTLERKAGAEFGTIVHRCAQILHARAVPLHEVEIEAVKIAANLCRGSDISVEAAANAATSINRNPLVHQPGVEFEFPVLVSLEDGNNTGPFIGGGIVDIVIFKEDHSEIYDIKTDQVSAEGLPALAHKYENQLTLYAQALEKVGCPPVTILGLLATSVRDPDNRAMLVPVRRSDG